jgi:hypothetical protein
MDFDQSIIDQALRSAIPVIDNTKDEAYYEAQRAKKNVDTLANHQFIQNMVCEKTYLNEGDLTVRKHISFDFAYAPLEGYLNETHSADQNAAIRDKIITQLMEGLRQIAFVNV